MSLTLIDPPTAEPVTLAELKEHLKLSGGAEDALLEGLLVAARRMIEARAGLAVMRQTWRLALDEAPQEALILPLAPVLSVDAVGAARGGLVEALPEAAYETQAGPVGRVRIKQPLAADRTLGGVVIVFTAGWPDAASVPYELKLAIRIAAAHAYEHREAEAPPPRIAPLIAPYRRLSL